MESTCQVFIAMHMVKPVADPGFSQGERRLPTPKYSLNLQLIKNIGPIRRRASLVSNSPPLGCARFLEFVRNFSECHTLWSLRSVNFLTFTLKLLVQTSLSVRPKLSVSVRSADKCGKFSKTLTTRVVSSHQGIHGYVSSCRFDCGCREQEEPSNYCSFLQELAAHKIFIIIENYFKIKATIDFTTFHMSKKVKLPVFLFNY